MARPGIEKNIKFKRLVRNLGIPKPYVLGLLETLWSVAYEAASPLIGNEEDVEIAAEWPGEPGQLFRALKEARWIEEINCQWHIHHLFENAPDYVRKRAAREASLVNKDLRSDVTGQRRKLVVSDRTTADNGGQRRPSQPSPAPPLPKEEKKQPIPPGGTARKRDSKPEPYSGAFEAFWKLYPKRNGVRVGKRKAFIEFLKIPDIQMPALMVALENLQNSDQLPKDAERFLRVDRTTNSAPWEDWVDQKGAHHERTNVGSRPLTRVDAPAHKYDGLANIEHFRPEKDQSSSADREGSRTD